MARLSSNFLFDFYCISWRGVCIFVGVQMIAEEKKELIDRRELYETMVRKMSEQYEYISFNSALTLKEIVEIFNEIPVQDELEAVWIFDGSLWRCSWCKLTALEAFGKSFPSKHCPYCGRRMRLENKTE